MMTNLFLVPKSARLEQKVKALEAQMVGLTLPEWNQQQNNPFWINNSINHVQFDCHFSDNKREPSDQSFIKLQKQLSKYEEQFNSFLQSIRQQKDEVNKLIQFMIINKVSMLQKVTELCKTNQTDLTLSQVEEALMANIEYGDNILKTVMRYQPKLIVKIPKQNITKEKKNQDTIDINYQSHIQTPVKSLQRTNQVSKDISYNSVQESYLQPDRSRHTFTNLLRDKSIPNSKSPIYSTISLTPQKHEINIGYWRDQYAQIYQKWDSQNRVISKMKTQLDQFARESTSQSKIKTQKYPQVQEDSILLRQMNQKLRKYQTILEAEISDIKCDLVKSQLSNQELVNRLNSDQNNKNHQKNNNQENMLQMLNQNQRYIFKMKEQEQISSDEIEQLKEQLICCEEENLNQINTLIKIKDSHVQNLKQQQDQFFQQQNIDQEQINQNIKEINILKQQITICDQEYQNQVNSLNLIKYNHKQQLKVQKEQDELLNQEMIDINQQIVNRDQLTSLHQQQEISDQEVIILRQQLISCNQEIQNQNITLNSLKENNNIPQKVLQEQQDISQKEINVLQQQLELRDQELLNLINTLNILKDNNIIQLGTQKDHQEIFNQELEILKQQIILRDQDLINYQNTFDTLKENNLRKQSSQHEQIQQLSEVVGLQEKEIENLNDEITQKNEGIQKINEEENQKSLNKLRKASYAIISARRSTRQITGKDSFFSLIQEQTRIVEHDSKNQSIQIKSSNRTKDSFERIQEQLQITPSRKYDDQEMDQLKKQIDLLKSEKDQMREQKKECKELIKISQQEIERLLNTLSIQELMMKQNKIENEQLSKQVEIANNQSFLKENIAIPGSTTEIQEKGDIHPTEHSYQDLDIQKKLELNMKSNLKKLVQMKSKIDILRSNLENHGDKIGVFGGALKKNSSNISNTDEKEQEINNLIQEFLTAVDQMNKIQKQIQGDYDAKMQKDVEKQRQLLSQIIQLKQQLRANQNLQEQFDESQKKVKELDNDLIKSKVDNKSLTEIISRMDLIQDFQSMNPSLISQSKFQRQTQQQNLAFIDDKRDAEKEMSQKDTDIKQLKKELKEAQDMVTALNSQFSKLSGLQSSPMIETQAITGNVLKLGHLIENDSKTLNDKQIDYLNRRVGDLQKKLDMKSTELLQEQQRSRVTRAELEEIFSTFEEDIQVKDQRLRELHQQLAQKNQKQT